MVKNIIHLIQINAKGNHNREIVMEPLDEAMFVEKSGRVSKSAFPMYYPMSLWDRRLSLHLAEGYVVRKEKSTINTEYAMIQEPSVQSLIDYLLDCSQTYIQQYLVDYQRIDQSDIHHAQSILKSLEQVKDLSIANDLLTSLFEVLPRNMDNVEDYYLSSMNPEEVRKMLSREQTLIDALSAQVEVSTQTVDAPDQTILDKFGLDVHECDEAEKAQVRRHLYGSTKQLFDTAFVVSNHDNEVQFRNYCQAYDIHKDNIHFLYHGSRNANFWSILAHGLIANPNAVTTGSMFGNSKHATYFADSCDKSLQYTDYCRAYYVTEAQHKKHDYFFLAVFEVAYKNPKDIYHWEPYMSAYTFDSIAPHDLVFAHANAGFLRRNEKISYFDLRHPERRQHKLKYLIRCKNK